MSSISPVSSSGSRFLMVVCYSLLGMLLALAIISKSLALNQLREYDPLLTPVLGASLTIAIAGWIVIVIRFRQIVTRIGNEGLAIIGLFAGLQFAVSFAALLVDSAVYMVTGPLAPFIAGIGDEGVRCLLLATLVTILPRRGVVMLSSVTVALLNGIVSGNLNASSLLFVTVGILTSEAFLAGMRVTTGSAFESPRSKPDWTIVARIALAIGIANGMKLFLQFCLNKVIFRMWFGDAYVAAVACSGLIYGVLGAVLGTCIGYRLRRTAR